MGCEYSWEGLAEQLRKPQRREAARGSAGRREAAQRNAGWAAPSAAP